MNEWKPTIEPGRNAVRWVAWRRDYTLLLWSAKTGTWFDPDGSTGITPAHTEEWAEDEDLFCSFDLPGAALQLAGAGLMRVKIAPHESWEKFYRGDRLEDDELRLLHDNARLLVELLDASGPTWPAATIARVRSEIEELKEQLRVPEESAGRGRVVTRYGAPTRAKDMRAEIEELKEQLRVAEEAQAEYDAAPARVRVAEELHGALCRANHADGCSWFYEDTQPARARNRYLEAADQLLCRFSEDQVRAFLAAVRGL